MSRLFWTWVRLEAWLYSRAMNAHLRLAAFYGATIRYPLYLTLDKIRETKWR